MNKIDFINKVYLSNGLKVFPVVENGKLPLIEAWQNDCSSDFFQVVYWLENAKNCNIGLPANENNLFIIDVDMHDVNGMASFNRLCSDLGIDIVDTLSQETPSGGRHFIFTSDEELKEVVNSANCFENYKGIDIRTKGYILVEPSTINGVPYRLDTNTIKPMPEKLRNFILNNNKVVEYERKEYEKPKEVDKGGRDNALFEYINNLYYKTRLDKDDIELLAYNFNRNVCNPPLTDNVVAYKLKKLFKKPRYKIIIIGLNEGEDEENDI